jgi:hypothetical protein
MDHNANEFTLPWFLTEQRVNTVDAVLIPAFL